MHRPQKNQPPTKNYGERKSDVDSDATRKIYMNNGKSYNAKLNEWLASFGKKGN